MEVIEETSSKLVLRANCFSWGGFLFWLLFPLGFGGIPLLFLFNTGVTTLSCQRVEPTLINCEKSESKLLGLIPGQSFSLKKIEEAKFNSQDDYDEVEYWVSVIAEGRETVVFEEFISVNEVKGDSRKMRAMASKINQFISSNEPSLIVRYDLRWKLRNLFFVPFLAIAILFLYLLLRWKIMETFTVDRNSKILRHKQKRLLGVKTLRHPLKGITAVEIEKTSISFNDEEMYKLNLLLPSASKARVEIYFGELQKVKEMAEKLSNFIEVPVSKKETI